MTVVKLGGVERNGLSGLVLRATVIALAAVMFGCVPKAPVAQAEIPAATSVATR